MKNKYLLCAFVGWMAVVLSGCSLFYVNNSAAPMPSAEERIQENQEKSKAADSLGNTEDLEAAEGMEGAGELQETPSLDMEGSGKAQETPSLDIEGAGKSPESAEKSVSRDDSENPLADASALDHEVQAYLDRMTLEDKVAQLFILYPETLVQGVNRVTAAKEMTREALNRRPVCGLIYMRQNLESKEQVQTMFSDFQKLCLERTGLPAFLCVDEEGGKVTSVGGTEALGISRGEDMADIGARNQPEEAFARGEEIGAYLAELGFNVDFAPVADVLSNPENTVVKKRSFGTDPAMVTAMAAAFSEGLQSKGILSTYKHFPGHGATAGDTHKGYSYTEKTLDELKECELLPFIDGIAKKVPMIMIGHISLPKVIGDDTPASLSSYIITDLLREELGYEGIIITDALAMGAIIKEYSSDEAAVKALEAGVDILLLPKDFELAYQGVLNAVNDGRLSQERIDQSLRRIIRQKLLLKEQMENQKETGEAPEKEQSAAEKGQTPEMQLSAGEGQTPEVQPSAGEEQATKEQPIGEGQEAGDAGGKS